MEDFQDIVTRKLNVLIMDDKDSIREILQEILFELGHEVTNSIEGNQTFLIYKEALEKNNRFDLVFLDLTIKGGLGGIDTIKKIRELDPYANVIVSSGYAETSVSNYKEAGFNAKLNKPYTIEEVNEVIYNLINI